MRGAIRGYKGSRQEKDMKKILNMGSINIDYVYTVPHFVRAGETLSSASLQIFPGGKGLNQSVALARAGGHVYHAGMLGSDGESLLTVLKEAGADVGLITRSVTPTGHAIIQVNPEGDNCILLFPGANRELDGDFADKALASFGKGDMLVLQNEVSCIAYAMNAAKAKGMDLVFNPSPYGPEILDYPLNLVDWWLLNEVEGQSLTGKKHPEDMLHTMAKIYPNAVIVLTLGGDGVICLANGRLLRHGGCDVQVVDTTAAGDTFTGYFISSIAMGKGIEEAIRLASAAAAISVTRKGAAVSIPCWEEVSRAASGEIRHYSPGNA
jgi:ribokinase